MSKFILFCNKQIAKDPNSFCTKEPNHKGDCLFTEDLLKEIKRRSQSSVGFINSLTENQKQIAFSAPEEAESFGKNEPGS